MGDMSSWVIGLLSGFVSSFIVALIFRRLEKRREAEQYLHNLLMNINELSYRLLAFHFEFLAKRYTIENFDESFNLIRSVFHAKPIYYSRYNISPAVRQFFPEYKRICDKLNENLKEYYRCMNLLHADAADNCLTPIERANAEAQQAAAAFQISGKSILFAELKDNIKAYLEKENP